MSSPSVVASRFVLRAQRWEIPAIAHDVVYAHAELHALNEYVERVAATLAQGASADAAVESLCLAARARAAGLTQQLIAPMSQKQRDLVMTYALLHDIGKVWAYAEGQLTDEARRLGHEALGYRALLPALASLEAMDPSSHEALDALLSGAWKRTCRHPAAALGEIVRAMDRFSAARAVGNASCGMSQ